MVRILHVLTSPRAEGTPRLVLDWLTVAGVEQGVLFLRPDPDDLIGAFQKRNCWMRVAATNRKKGWNYGRVFCEVRQATKQFQPELVVAWSAYLSHWIHLGARSASRADLITHLGTAPGQGIYSRYLYTWLCLGIGRICGHHAITCSQFVQKEYLSIPFLGPDHVRAVYNCCDLPRFLRPAHGGVRDPARVCMVGSLEHSKDHPSLLRAWKMVEAVGDFELCLAGDGSRRPELEALARELGLRRVRFLGMVNDVPGLLWTTAVFAFSANENEGFGTVLIEALAAGCSIVAADVPACREVLRDGRYGTLVQPHNPEALARGIIDRLTRSDHETRKGMGIEYALEFTPEKMISEYSEISKE